jgi:uncharacterized protein (TIGR00730 family)
MGFEGIHQQAARAFGKALAERQLKLVYGAGNVGLMGEVANAVLAHGGQAIGVIPQFLKDWEVAHLGLDQLIVTETMHARKEKMADISDAFVALSGGFGTMDELFEILTWSQLQLHQKPIVLLNLNGFYDPLLAMIDQLVTGGFLKAENQKLLLVAKSVEEIFEQIEKFTASPALGKWI